MVWSYITVALEEMQAVGSPHVVNLGRMVSNPWWGERPHMEQGQRVTVKE